MSNYLCECETNDYGLDTTGLEYAKLFSLKTNINNSNYYNDCQIIFRVIHFSSLNGIAKPQDFILTCVRENLTTDIVTFKNLTDAPTTFRIGYKNVDGEITVYGKGWKIGARLKVQVLYCTTLSMFKFYNCENFTNAIADLTYATNFKYDYPITFQNSWVDNAYLTSKCIKRDKEVTVNLCISDGSLAENDIICTLPVPVNAFRVPCVDNTKNAGYLELSSSGDLRPRLITTNKDVTCFFTYISKE